MKIATALCIFAMAAFVSAKSDTSTYTDRYDNIDINQLIKNKRLLIPYIKCALEQGKCSPEGRELKSHIKEALENYCSKCTNRQRQGTHQIISHLINNEPRYWSDLANKYDPARKYVVRYEQELRKLEVKG